jgi:hypothetical protein
MIGLKPEKRKLNLIRRLKPTAIILCKMFNFLSIILKKYLVFLYFSFKKIIAISLSLGDQLPLALAPKGSIAVGFSPKGINCRWL